MIKGKRFNLIIGLIIFVLIIGTKLGSVYAKIGDNPIRNQNLYTYQDNHDGVHIRTDCKPGYTQVTSTDSIYNGCYKTVTYHVSGYKNKNYYCLHDIENNGRNVYVYTAYTSVGPYAARRYHRGTVCRTADAASGTAEKYMRTVYSSAVDN